MYPSISPFYDSDQWERLLQNGDEKSVTDAMQGTLWLDFLKDLDKIEKNHLFAFKSFLFKKNASKASPFELIMQGKQANLIFDLLLKVLTEDELNEDLNKKIQVFDYAYSMKRYEYIFLKAEDLPDEEIKEAESYVKSHQMDFTNSIQEEYTKKKYVKYMAWLNQRRLSSTTLSRGESSDVEAANRRWDKAEETRTSYSTLHRGKDMWFDLSNIQVMHIKMCRGEESISHPGIIRDDMIRTGGGWGHLYCLPKYLDANVDKFMAWFNASLIRCEQKEVNPIIFASQTYQRFVSLHPFENGNGRMSRFLMDYVLERFKLPPPILGKDVLDALFPLDPLKTDQLKFIKKIIEGIEKSRKMLSEH